MGLFSKLFGKQEATAVPTAAVAELCPHTTLVPKWTNIDHIGDEAKATSWSCEGCQQTFSGDEGRTLRQTEAERLQHRATREPPTQ